MPKNLKKIENQLEDPLAELEVGAEVKPQPEVKERIPAPETKPEQQPAKQLEQIQEGKVSEKEKPQEPQTASAQVQPQAIDENIDPETYKKVEVILAEGLSDIYNSLPADKKQEFKQAGEETTKKITLLLKETKVKVKKIFDLIVGWLKIIPGVNKFFLEQEAKIKADNILEINKRK